jgi:DNA-binding beta-propeller fold protein YncE
MSCQPRGPSRRFARPLLTMLIVLSATLRATAGSAQSGPAAGYHLVKTIPVGADGGWDYATVDPAARRLYVSHATKMVVIDIDRDSVVGELKDTPGIHGIALAPALQRGFTSNGRDSTVTIFDLKTLGVLGRVKVTGANPDAIHFDAITKRVFTFNGRSANATALDAATGAVVGTIALAGKPEFAQTDGRGRLFVNIETDPGQIQVIDTRTLAVIKTYPLTGCDGPSGLSYDRANDRLFSVCGNRVLAVSNPTSGTVVTTVPVGPGVDAVSYDESAKLLFASNGGDGTMTVIRQEGADRYTSLGNAATRVGSRTMTLDPVTHRVYLASVQYGPTPAPTTEQPRPRAPIVPGSFSILVLDRK